MPDEGGSGAVGSTAGTTDPFVSNGGADVDGGDATGETSGGTTASTMGGTSGTTAGAATGGDTETSGGAATSGTGNGVPDAGDTVADGGDSVEPGDDGTFASGTDPLPPLPDDVALPIVFVHGFAGSASQYMSQKMRFVANGYPADRIVAYDHDGAGFSTSGFLDPLDDVVDEVLSRTGASQVFLVGHSRGTFVSSSYLGDSERAAKVAKYVAIDGSPCPGGVECIAPTQAMFSGQKHVEVCTSKESFAMQYEFLIGEAPEVVDIVPQKAPVEIRGRAVNFPENTGREGATVSVFEIDAETGARASADPIDAVTLAADGFFGPVTVRPDRHYEIELAADGGFTHYYYQPFLRSTDFVRLLSAPPDAPSRTNLNRGAGHAALTAMRMREWLESDVIEVSTTSASQGDEPAVNAMTSEGGERESIAYYMHDAAASPGDSTLDALPYYSDQPFQHGVDLFMPAADPTDGVITVRNLPRGDANAPQTLRSPNWASADHLIVVNFSDFPQDAATP